MNAKKTALFLALTTSLAASVLAIQVVPVAAASGAPGWSWNLSRDMLTDVSGGSLNNNSLNNAWEFYDINNLLPTASPSGSCYGGGAPVTCWEDPGLGFRVSGLVGIATQDVVSPGCPQASLTHGVPIMHPAQGGDVWVRWTNPLGQPLKIQVLGRFSTIDPCGPGWEDGVTWSVFDQSGNQLATNVLHSTPSLPQDTDIFFFSHSVNPGDYLDFVVSPNSNYYYDTTELDVLIAGQ